MLSLKNHPFAVAAHFDRSLVLTYAVPAAEAAALLPLAGPLVPDLWQEQWAFVAVALVQTRALRPAGLPPWLGTDFFLIGYRVFVRYHDRRGRRLRGLYILQTQTDRARMTLLGNLFTHYRYHTIDVRQREAAGEYEVISEKAGLRLRVQTAAAEAAEAAAAVPLPPGSPFATWAEARRFAGPLPFTFSYDAARRRVLLVEGQRESWAPRPVAVQSAQVAFFEHLTPTPPVLANAFLVEDIPYRWAAGRTELWTPNPS